MNTTTVVEEIQRIKNNIENAYSSLEEIGATLPEERNSDNLQIVIKEVPVGGGDEELEGSYRSMLDTTAGSNCTKLPNGITSLRDYAFYYCTNLAIKELPKTLTYIGKSAFANCTNLELTEIWGGLKSGSTYVTIQQNCYLSCTKLKNIKIININNPNNYPIHLDNKCFQKCTGLLSVEFDEKVAAIADYTFDGCTNLKTLICRGATPPKIYTTSFNSVPLEAIYVPDAALSTYRSASNWSKFSSLMKPLSEYGG